MKRIGIIGGTFDPIHLAHTNIAKEAKEKLDLDKVIFIPAGSQPLKLDKKVTKASLRFNMVKKAIEGFKGFEVSDYEIKKQGLSYTFETLEHFHKEEEKLYFITGADCLLDLEKWGNVKRIFELCTLVVLTRPGYDNEKLYKQKEYIENKYNGEIIIFESEGLDISSTEIREKVKTGKDIRRLVTKEVFELIKDNGLYMEE
ncbi:MAG: nicotinate-nucleotide adenylyltransferase [Clostridium sp.]|uniref:nicotinate-nucleotide adenylyltransferase n=1 Tax=Clostridium sp. DSM 8431 TaxID=1761781 RepID=UPI0008F1947B|nr:nicotinate-nucleotide adenylyltransferase [Clostridium sp. DSM 8431]MCR4944246.1 nicotinate-nucleotide adenylyltransferase [Clostridium sp.]SFU66476.1 nicotinate-nucleotide adenylyltransferase [Clostridium sp. DSM 8431]